MKSPFIIFTLSYIQTWLNPNMHCLTQFLKTGFEIIADVESSHQELSNGSSLACFDTWCHKPLKLEMQWGVRCYGYARGWRDYISSWNCGVKCGGNINVFASNIFLRVACMQNIALQVPKNFCNMWYLTEHYDA